MPRHAKTTPCGRQRSARVNTPSRHRTACRSAPSGPAPGKPPRPAARKAAARLSNDFARTFAQLADAIEALTGLHCVWKNAAADNADRLDIQYAEHRHVPCQIAKAHAGGIERCVADDNRRAARRACRLRAPFVKRCHAGLWEIVVPVFQGERYEGMLFAGPFVPEGRRAAQPGGGPTFTRAQVRAVQALLLPLVAHLAAQRDLLRLTSATSRRKGDQMAAVRAYLEAHYTEPIRLADAAALMHVGVSRFRHAFAASVGVSFGTYLGQLRLARAKALLEEGSLPMGMVAVQAGFGSQAYFARFFRQHTGMPPSAWRKDMATVNRAQRPIRI